MIKTTSMLTAEPKRYGFSKSNSLYLFVLRFLRAGRNTAATATSTAAGTMISSVGIRCKIDRFGGCGLFRRRARVICAFGRCGLGR